MGRIDRTDRKDTSTGRTVARTDRTQYQQSRLSQSQLSQLSILLSVKKKALIEGSIDRKEYVSTGHRTNTLIGGADRRERHIDRRGGAQ